MKLWTIQNIEAYENLKNTGILRTDESFIYDDMIFHYKWMVAQMKKRIGLPASEKTKYPIWAWYQWNGIKKKRPDLRYSVHLPRGTKGVLLKLEVDSRNVLLSDFDDFNIVLNLDIWLILKKNMISFIMSLKAMGFVMMIYVI